VTHRMLFKPSTGETLRVGFHWALYPVLAPRCTLLAPPQVVEVREHDQQLHVFTTRGTEPYRISEFWFGDFIASNQHPEQVVGGAPGERPESCEITHHDLELGTEAVRIPARERLPRG